MIQFKLHGLEIKIDFLFVSLVTFFLLTDKTGISAIALLSCFIHELGHLIMFFIVGYTPQALIFELTGIRLIKPEEVLSPKRDALVQIAGSGLNLLIFFILYKTTKTMSRWSIFTISHLLLGIFNLLPLKNLDGGKLLNLFCIRFLGEYAADRITAIADWIITLLLLGIAIYTLISGKRSITYLFFSGGLFITTLAKLHSKINIGHTKNINIK